MRKLVKWPRNRKFQAIGVIDNSKAGCLLQPAFKMVQPYQRRVMEDPGSHYAHLKRETGGPVSQAARQI